MKKSQIVHEVDRLPAAELIHTAIVGDELVCKTGNDLCCQLYLHITRNLQVLLPGASFQYDWNRDSIVENRVHLGAHELKCAPVFCLGETCKTARSKCDVLVKVHSVAVMQQ